MTIKFSKSLILFTLYCLLAIASAISAKPRSSGAVESPRKVNIVPDTSAVAKVIDGDTFELASGKRVRIMGVDTPEKGEPFADAARAFTDSLLKSEYVKIELGSEPKDKYGRLLAYVFVKSGFLNEMLLRHGFARAYLFSKKERYNSRLISAQKDARQKKVGIWSLPAPAPEPYYVAAGGSFRFHRPLCPLIEDINPRKAKKFKSRDTALDQGLSPCRECRP